MQDRHISILKNNAITEAWQIAWLANFYGGPIYSVDFKSLDFGRAEFIVLFCLEHEPGITATEICLACGRPRNTISRAVRKMLDLGWIEGTADTADYRRVFLRNTDLGRQKLNEALGFFQKRYDLLFSPLSEAERGELSRLLAKLVIRDDDFGAIF